MNLLRHLSIAAVSLACFLLASNLCAQSGGFPDGSAAGFRSALFDIPFAPAPTISAESEQAGRKSGFIAALYSLLLPGMGELYAGDFQRGKVNLIADGALWLGFAGLNYAAAWTRNDGQTFAAEHAGVRTDGKDDQYFVDVGNFIDIHEYNQKKLRDKTINILYNEDPSAGLYWKWDSDRNRQTFHDTRVRADQLANGGRFVIVGLIANRIWSAIRAATMAGEYNRGLLTGALSRMDLRAGGMRDPAGSDGIVVAFSARF